LKPERRAARPPLEGAREAPFFMRANTDDDPGDGLTLDGYGAVFNRETIIDSYEGRFREMIANASMKRSFRETPPKVQFDHGRHPLIGSIPIAELRSISEDSDPVLAPDGGAHVIARIFDNWLMQPVRDAIKGKAIDGMSFRFSVIREMWQTADGKTIKDDDELMSVLRQTWNEDVPDDELPLRTLKELKVPEIGPVTWPAYTDTSVSVRSKIIDLGRLNEPGQRKLLAEAVFIADAASQDDDAQRDATDESVAVEHPSESDDAQQDTDSVVEHPSPPDAQRDTTPVVKHPSKPRGRRGIDVTLRTVRDMLIQIDKKGTP